LVLENLTRKYESRNKLVPFVPDFISNKKNEKREPTEFKARLINTSLGHE